MESEKDSDSINLPPKKQNGGARPGAGRPKGSTGKITARNILEQAEKILGQPLVDSILQGYHESIINQDKRTRVVYEKMLLDKVATTLLDVEVTDDESMLEAKQAAFAAALARAMGTDETAK